MHGRRHRHPHPLHLPAADRDGHRLGHHHADRRRHRLGHGHLGDDLHARPVEHHADAPGGRGPADQRRASWARATAACPKPLDEQIRGRRLRPEAARGLGHDARRHRHQPDGGRRVRHPDRHPHRHAQRVGLRRRHDRRDQGPGDPHLPHRGRRRRPRPGHHQHRRPAQRPALQHQPDPAVHRQHDRRAPRHADGLPSPVAEHPRGRGVRREPHPGRDHRRRGRLPRPRHHQHDELRLAGDGPDRRGDRPDAGRPPTR